MVLKWQMSDVKENCENTYSLFYQRNNSRGGVEIISYL